MELCPAPIPMPTTASSHLYDSRDVDTLVANCNTPCYKRVQHINLKAKHKEEFILM